MRFADFESHGRVSGTNVKLTDRRSLARDEHRLSDGRGRAMSDAQAVTPNMPDESEATDADGTRTWSVYSDEEWKRVWRAHVGWKTFVIILFIGTMLGLAIWSSQPEEADISRAASFFVFALVAASLAAFAFGPGLLECLGGRASALTGCGGIFFVFARPVLAADKILRGPIARICGLDIHGLAPRYVLLFLHIGFASALVWLVPLVWEEGDWLGYVGLGWAIVALIAVVRKWIWIENTYERLAGGFVGETTKRFPQLRDEALFSVLIFFLLVPVVLWKLDTTFPLFEAAPGHVVSPSDWVALFGGELVKAIPLVDWAEVYNVGATNTLQPLRPYGQAAVFATRVIVDLVLIGALFYGVERVGQIARQWREFVSGRRWLMDPTLEQRVLRLLRADSRGRSWFAETPASDLGPFVRYDSSRLRALATIEDDDSVNVAIVLHTMYAKAPIDEFTPLARDLLFPKPRTRKPSLDVLEMAVKLLALVRGGSARAVLERVMSEFDGCTASENWRMRAKAASEITRAWLELDADQRTERGTNEVVDLLRRGLERNNPGPGQARAAIADELARVGGGRALSAIADHLAGEQASTVLERLAHDMSRMRETAPSHHLRRAAERARRRAALIENRSAPRAAADESALVALNRVADDLDRASGRGDDDTTTT